MFTPALRERSFSLDYDQWDRGTSKDPMNPWPEWIRRLFYVPWSVWSWVIGLDLPQKNAL